MAELSGLDMVREIIGQINNLRRLVTINGKKYKWDGKKYVRAVDGKKFTKKELVSYVKNEKFEAPKTPKVRKTNAELKTTKITKDSKGRRVVNPEGNKLKIKRQDILGDVKNKAQGLKSQIVKVGKQGLNKGNQVLQNVKLNIMQPGGQAAVANRAQLLNRYIKGLTPKSFMGGATKGVAGLIADNLLMSGANQLTDRGFRALAGKNQMSLQDFRTARDKGELKGTLRNRLGIKPPQQTVNTAPTERDIREDQLINFLEQQKTNPVKETYVPEKVVTPPNQGTDSTKKNETVDKVKIKTKKPNTYWKSPVNYEVKKEKKGKKKDSLKVNKQLERRKKAIRRAYGNISDKRMKQLLSRAVTQRELEES